MLKLYYSREPIENYEFVILNYYLAMYIYIYAMYCMLKVRNMYII